MRGGGEGPRPQSQERPSTSLVQDLVSLVRMLGEGLVGLARLVGTVLVALFTLAALLAPWALGLWLLIAFLTGIHGPWS